MPLSGQVICEFRFQCDKQWRDLSEVKGEDGVRYCADCTKPVFLCHTYDELAEHVAQAHCVAIEDGHGFHLLGDVAFAT